MDRAAAPPACRSDSTAQRRKRRKKGAESTMSEHIAHKHKN